MKKIRRKQINRLMKCIMSKQLDKAIVLPNLIIPQLIDKMFAFDKGTKNYLSSQLPEKYSKKLRMEK